jgi:glycosyltransferase involved in cell wall biosynthesis
LIAGHDNIEILGFVSEEKMIDLYKKAKVFALPSINEGVGLVALEAASFGCDVVITEIGGPKEYYGDMAYVVNPYSVDDIGMKVVEALKTTKQPQLFNHVMNNYSENILSKKLEASYLHIIKKTKC